MNASRSLPAIGATPAASLNRLEPSAHTLRIDKGRDNDIVISTGKNEHHTIEVFDLFGALLYRVKGSGARTHQLDAGMTASGVRSVRARIDGQESAFRLGTIEALVSPAAE